MKRRFDFHINTPELIYMDDYAHHPEELRAALSSVRGMFPGRKITAVFQPHLYTRTRDFHRGFAQALSLADEVLLVPIYPAREEPIEGVSSDMIAELLTVPHRTVPLEHIAFETEKARPDILITFGAGNIENYTAKSPAGCGNGRKSEIKGMRHTRGVPADGNPAGVWPPHHCTAYRPSPFISVWIFYRNFMAGIARQRLGSRDCPRHD